MIAEKRVEQHLVAGVAAGRAAERPDIVGDETIYPGARVFADERDRRARAEFGGAEHRVRGRIGEHRPDAPVETAAVFRRQEERRVTVAGGKASAGSLVRVISDHSSLSRNGTIAWSTSNVDFVR